MTQKAYTEAVIVGAGPAGMFCADVLADAGMKVAIVDKGKPMVMRKCPKSQACSCAVCDILCGAGGAGGFSDGKNTLSLTRGTQMEELFPPEAGIYMHQIDELVAKLAETPGVQVPEVATSPDHRFNKYGFRFSSYPLRHVGSDGIRKWVIGMEKRLQEKGVQIVYGADVQSILDGPGGQGINGVRLSRGNVKSRKVIIASGLDGAPWLGAELQRCGAQFEPGPAGFAIRLETSAAVLAPLFDTFYDWKMERGRLRSFCCNQRGEIVNENHASLGVRNVNGHSFLDAKLKTESSNAAIMSKITPEMVEDPQETVRETARKINGMVGGHTVIQRTSDFIANRPTHPKGIPEGDPVRTNWQARSGVNIGDGLVGIPGLYEDYVAYLCNLDRIVPGVIGEQAYVYAPEVKYYSPRVKIGRDWQVVGIPGLYVIGNASGYLDSFVAAATSGIISAKAIIGGN
jgi:hypothetical protein